MNRHFSDAIRIVLLMGVAGAYLIMSDPANAAVFQSLAIGVFLVGGTHLMRRILFNSIDLQEIVRSAVDDKSLPAAIVVLAFMFFLVAVMYLSLQVLN